MKALVLACVLASAATAHAACVLNTCLAMDTTSACQSISYGCIDLGGQLTCGTVSVSQPPLGTPCETDNNECTVDACGGMTGMTTGDGVCHHVVVPDGTACAGGTGGCASGTCTCAAGTKMCGAVCIADSACCVDDDCLSLAMCLEGATCVNNACVGTQKACTPSGVCRVSTCDDSSGQCVEALATAGSSCSAGGCVQNALCDDTGACIGDPAPDGTPCEDDCGAATCTMGVCGCGAADAGVVAPTDLSSAPSPGKQPAHGCSFATSAPTSTATVLLLAIVAVFIRRRIVEACGRSSSPSRCSR